MFHINVMAEDTTIIAEEIPRASDDPKIIMQVTIVSNFDGTRWQKQMPLEDARKITNACLDCNEPHPDMYPELEKIIEGCPNICRPIP